MLRSCQKKFPESRKQGRVDRLNARRHHFYRPIRKCILDELFLIHLTLLDNRRDPLLKKLLIFRLLMRVQILKQTVPAFFRACINKMTGMTVKQNSAEMKIDRLSICRILMNADYNLLLFQTVADPNFLLKHFLYCILGCLP